VSTTLRGYECKIALYKAFDFIFHGLQTVCPGKHLPVAPDGNDTERVISWQAIYFHFQK
jgi:hypothetical protein